MSDDDLTDLDALMPFIDTAQDASRTQLVSLCRQLMPTLTAIRAKLDAADRIDALEDKLARAEWLLTDAAVQLEEGKIKTRRNRAALIWQFLKEIKST